MQIKVFHIRLAKEHLKSDEDELNEFMDNVVVKKTVSELIMGHPNFWSILVFYTPISPKDDIHTSTKFTVNNLSELSNQELQVFEALKQWRFDKAQELGIPLYMVFANNELMSIAKAQPQNAEDLLKIKGIGGYKAAQYGDDVLAILNSF